MAKPTRTTVAKKIANNIVAERTKFLQTNTNAVNYKLRLESISKLKVLINKVADIAGMDTSRVAKRMEVATKSEYGKVPGLLNLLSAIVKYPTDNKSPGDLTATKEEIVALTGVDEVVFSDLREAKGYPTFLTDDHERMDGVEPDYEEYEMLCNLMANDLNIPVVDIKLDQAKWDRAEAKAQAKVEKDLIAIEAQLEEYRKLNGQQVA